MNVSFKLLLVYILDIVVTFIFQVATLFKTLYLNSAKLYKVKPPLMVTLKNVYVLGTEFLMQ